jgi:hypothetical protein
MAYTDLFNEAIDDLATTLATITGLRVVTDPRNLNSNCCFIDAPSFEALNDHIVTVTFPVRIIGIGPGNLDTLRPLLAISASLLGKNVGVNSGTPALASIGGQEFPAYDISIRMQAQNL